jgi:uncharacterized protein (TIGR00730 family)
MTVIRSVCVYCGSSDYGPPAHRAAAVQFGRLLAENDLQLVFGGGRVGLMGAIADAVLQAGGRAVGIIPEHLVRAEVGHAQVSELIIVASMHTRKETMFARSDAFVILPGGPGTLDELFEILTWRQLALHDKPIVVVNLDGYWDPLLALIDAIIAARYVGPKFRRFFTVVERVEDVLPALREAAEPQVASQPERL